MYRGSADGVASPPRRNFPHFRRCAYKWMSRSGKLELRGFSGRSCRDRLTRSTRYHRDSGSVLILVRLAILDPCRQVCNASFTFLGLLTRRWHTLCCSEAFGAHVRRAAATPFKGPLAQLVSFVYTRAADRVPSPPRRKIYMCFCLDFFGECIQVLGPI